MKIDKQPQFQSLFLLSARACARARLPKLSNQTCDLTAATCPSGIDTRYVHRMSTEGHINCKGQQTCAVRDAENAGQVHAAISAAVREAQSDNKTSVLLHEVATLRVFKCSSREKERRGPGV